MAAVDLWLSADRSRYFLVPEVFDMPPGDFDVRTIPGTRQQVALDAIRPFELTDEQARRIAKDQLGQTLEELKPGIDERLAELRARLDEHNRRPVKTTLTPNAVPALLEFLKKLPGVIANSLARDANRVESARTTMADLQRRLKDVGIDLDDRLTNFPGRLAELREEVHKPKT